MLFELIIALIPIGILLLLIVKDNSALYPLAPSSLLFGVIGASVLSIFTLETANTCAVIIEQDRVIKTFEQKRDSLYNKLSAFDFRQKQPDAKFLWNHDTPVKTITLQLEKIEDQLAQAKRKRDEAWVKYRATKIGPFNHVFNYIDCGIEK